MSGFTDSVDMVMKGLKLVASLELVVSGGVRDTKEGKGTGGG